MRRFYLLNKYVYLNLVIIWLQVQIYFVDIKQFLKLCINPKYWRIVKIECQLFITKRELRGVENEIVNLCKKNNIWDYEIRKAWKDTLIEQKKREKINPKMRTKNRPKSDYFRKIISEKLMSIEEKIE